MDSQPLTMEDAIARGDVVEFRKLCAALSDRELFLVSVKASVYRQPTLRKAAEKILIERGVIR